MLADYHSLGLCHSFSVIVPVRHSPRIGVDRCGGFSFARGSETFRIKLKYPPSSLSGTPPAYRRKTRCPRSDPTTSPPAVRGEAAAGEATPAEAEAVGIRAALACRVAVVGEPVGHYASWRPWFRRRGTCRPATRCRLNYTASNLVSRRCLGPTVRPGKSRWCPVQLHRFFRHYLNLVYMNHGYEFFAPDPAGTHLVSYRVAKPDGTTVEGRFPGPPSAVAAVVLPSPYDARRANADDGSRLGTELRQPLWQRSTAGRVASTG